MLSIPEYKSAERVFHYFEEISKIPHGSGDTDKIAEYLVNFANERGLFVKRDSANNVIIRKNATRGYTDRPTVIIQGHIDMVLAKTADCTKDLTVEGIEMYRDGDFIKAKGTTLGGDDGVAVAYALALLESDDIPHPELEIVMTSDEEIGLLGAAALDASELHGKVMLNIDSDGENIFTAGCAGGMRIDAKISARTEKKVTDGIKITISGFKGGHSGANICFPHANAIKALGEVMATLGGEVGALKGGNADNAIPRNAECVIYGTDAEAAKAAAAAIIEKYREVEPEGKYEITEGVEAEVYSKEVSGRIAELICDEPNGIVAMSEEVPGQVETSLNMGILECDGTGVTVSFSLRSSKGAKKAELATRVTKIAESKGAECDAHSAYPGWEYRKESPLRDTICEVYKRMYGKDAKVVTIHAGLECGIFSDKIEGLDCISMGPNCYDIHTTEERLSISSAARVWEFLKEVLKSI